MKLNMAKALDFCFTTLQSIHSYLSPHTTGVIYTLLVLNCKWNVGNPGPSGFRREHTFALLSLSRPLEFDLKDVIIVPTRWLSR